LVLLVKICPECGKPFKKGREGQWLCSTACNRKAGNRELARARVLYRALYWWRYDRRNSGDDLVFICREIRSWIDEDKRVGRPPPARHRHDADRGHARRRAV
jgi:hypothetical protein